MNSVAAGLGEAINTLLGGAERADLSPKTGEITGASHGQRTDKVAVFLPLANCS